MPSLNKSYCIRKMSNNASILPKEANQDEDLHAFAEQKAALDQRRPRELLFSNRVGTSRMPSPLNFFLGGIWHLQPLKTKNVVHSRQNIEVHPLFDVRRVSPSSAGLSCLLCSFLSSTTFCCQLIGKITICKVWRIALVC